MRAGRSSHMPEIMLCTSVQNRLSPPAYIRFAAGSVDISPLGPVLLGGFRVRPHAAPPIPNSLEANALVLHDTAGSTQVIVSIDTLYVGRPLTEAIEGWLS